MRAWALINCALYYNDWKDHDPQGLPYAEEALAMKDIPDDDRALAYCHRATLTGSDGRIDTIKGKEDLNRALSLPNTSETIKAILCKEMAFLYCLEGNDALHEEYLKKAIGYTNAAARIRISCISNLHQFYGQNETPEEKMERFRKIASVRDPDYMYTCYVYEERGKAREAIGDFAGAEADYTSIILQPFPDPQYLADAYSQRAALREKRGNLAESLNDCLRSLSCEGQSAHSSSMAAITLNKVLDRLKADDPNFDPLLLITGGNTVLADAHSIILAGRARARARAGKIKEALSDYTEACEWNGISNERRAINLIDRGKLRGKSGDAEGDIADQTQALSLSGLTDLERTAALVARGYAKQTYLSRMEDAARDYQEAMDQIDIPDSARNLARANYEEVMGILAKQKKQ